MWNNGSSRPQKFHQCYYTLHDSNNWALYTYTYIDKLSLQLWNCLLSTHAIACGKYVWLSYSSAMHSDCKNARTFLIFSAETQEDSTSRLIVGLYIWINLVHIMYFSNSNQLLRCMSTSIQILFVDGTFKPEWPTGCMMPAHPCDSHCHFLTCS